MNRPTIEVADIFRARGNDFIDRHCVGIQQLKAIRAITQCRTAALGGHVDVCPQCGGDPSISYNSCRNRHCNKCQSQALRRFFVVLQSYQFFGALWHASAEVCLPLTISSHVVQHSVVL